MGLRGWAREGLTHDFRRPVNEAVGNRDGLPESLQKIVPEAVEIEVAFSQVFDLPNRMKDHRVVIASEAPAELWTGRGPESTGPGRTIHVI